MSSPARTVEPDETVAKAMVACQRYGQSGILVAEGDRLVGVGRPGGSRPRDRARALARAGQGDHEHEGRDVRRGDPARGAAAAALERRRPRRRSPRRAHPRRRHALRPSPGAGRAGGSRRARGADAHRRALSPRASATGLRGGRGRLRAVRGRLPRRRHASATSCSASAASTSTSRSRATRSPSPRRSRTRSTAGSARTASSAPPS